MERALPDVLPPVCPTLCPGCVRLVTGFCLTFAQDDFRLLGGLVALALLWVVLAITEWWQGGSAAGVRCAPQDGGQPMVRLEQRIGRPRNHRTRGSLQAAHE
jgi:hypothetical protein